MKTLFDSGDVIKIAKDLKADMDKLWCFAEKCCAKIPVNIGTGFGLYKRLNSSNWEFKSILAGDNVTITEQSNTITINSTGGGAVTCEDIDVCLGISSSGAANKYLNEQGDFVIVSGSGFTCSDLSICSTTNLPEGSNLYFTNARAISALTGQNISIFTNDSGYITSSALSPYLTTATAASTYYPLSNPSSYIPLTALSAGTGISYNNLTGVITNSLPDQTVVLSNGTGISIAGTYPNFTITNTAPSTTNGTVTSVALSTPSGLSVTGSPITTSGTFEITLTPNYVIPTTTQIANSETAYNNRITSLTTTGTSGAATLIANTLNIPQYTGGGNETLAQTLALGNTTGGTDISVSAGDDIIITDATASTITFFDASKKLVSADTATYPTITELSYVKGVTSSIQTQLNSVVHEDPVILAYQALGSTIKANAVGLSFNRLTTAITLADQNEMYVAVYLPIAQTITGVKWYQGSAGNYTANNYNGVGLYSYSGGTMTLVASSTDDGNIWKATSNTVASKAFSSTYAAAAGIYFVGALWCRSAVVTAPSLYGAVATATLAAGAVDFTDSAKLYSTKAAGISLPASRLQSATTGTNSQLFFALY